MITKISNGLLLKNGEVLKGLDIYFEKDKITAVTTEKMPFDKEIDASGKYVTAGFIDLHLHGGGGADFMDGGVEPIVTAADFHLHHGTTSMMPTTLACSVEVLRSFLQDLKTVIDGNMTDADLIGAHLEGPYFAVTQCGAQNPKYITDPVKTDYTAILNDFKELISRWDFAPERDGSREFCEYLVENNVVPAIAHSDAMLSEIEPVYNAGCRLVTHLYSGMSGLMRKDGYRKLGVIESTYLLNEMNAEIIADGDHLPPELLKLIIKGMGVERLCAVTDAMRGAGQPEGPSFLGRKGEETPCIIEDGIAKMPDRTCFAGSVATADRLLRTLTKKAEMPIEKSVLLLNENPAKLFKLETKGQISKGYDADVVVFDEDINLSTIIARGKTIV